MGMGMGMDMDMDMMGGGERAEETAAKESFLPVGSECPVSSGQWVEWSVDCCSLPTTLLHYYHYTNTTTIPRLHHIYLTVLPIHYSHSHRYIHRTYWYQSTHHPFP